MLPIRTATLPSPLTCKPHPSPRYLNLGGYPVLETPAHDLRPAEEYARAGGCRLTSASAARFPSHVWLSGRIRPPVTRGFHKPPVALDVRCRPTCASEDGCSNCYSRCCRGLACVDRLAISRTRVVSARFLTHHRTYYTRISPVMRLYSTALLYSAAQLRHDVTSFLPFPLRPLFAYRPRVPTIVRLCCFCRLLLLRLCFGGTCPVNSSVSQQISTSPKRTRSTPSTLYHSIQSSLRSCHFPDCPKKGHNDQTRGLSRVHHRLD